MTVPYMNRIPWEVRGIGPSRQAGAALVMSLVMLLVLTILGVAAMSTSSLEERMAGNIQEATHAFQAAESGLNRAANTSGVLSLTGTTTNTWTFGSAQAQVTVTPLEFSSPKRGSGYSATSFDAANFDQRSAGTAAAGARSILHRGVAQIVPKN